MTRPRLTVEDFAYLTGLATSSLAFTIAASALLSVSLVTLGTEMLLPLPETNLNA